MTQKIRSIFTFTLITLCGFALASCGGGSGNKSTGNPANTEVINGIPVPPEPDPVQNNATVAGVDVNSNGVRDDVERLLANKSKTNGEFIENLQLGQTAAKILTNFEKNSLREEIITNACKLKKMSLSNDVLDILLNTKEREAAYSNGIKKLDGGFYMNSASCGGGSDDL